MVRTGKPIASVLLVLASAALCSGCLSIGGKLALEENPAAESRLSSLEARRNAVEQSPGSPGAASLPGR